MIKVVRVLGVVVLAGVMLVLAMIVIVIYRKKNRV